MCSMRSQQNMLTVFPPLADCPSVLNNNCFHNGTEVLDAFSYSTTISGVYFDYFGLVCLGLTMHIIAFLGIRRFIRSTGYYWNYLWIFCQNQTWRRNLSDQTNILFGNNQWLYCARFLFWVKILLKFKWPFDLCEAGTVHFSSSAK